jgi:hypothetical protein
MPRANKQSEIRQVAIGVYWASPRYSKDKGELRRVEIEVECLALIVSFVVFKESCVREVEMYSECSRPCLDERKERGCRREGSWVEGSGSRIVRGTKLSVGGSGYRSHKE